MRALAHRLAQEAPQLATLTPAQLETVARAVIADKLKEELRQEADFARIAYPEERHTFLTAVGTTRSAHTARAYHHALTTLEAFAAYQGIPVLAMKAKEADDFAYALTNTGRAPASIRRDLAAVSSFFSFLERRFEFIRNPFRGTKARPPNKGIKPTRYPTTKDLTTLLPVLPDPIRAAAVVMAERGLRVGALPSLIIHGLRFTAHSKGKDISGEFPPTIIAAIKSAGLDGKRPFAAWSETQIADQFRYTTGKLAKAGVIAAPYSVHDLRHYYAVKEYRNNKDLLRVRTLLGHTSVQVTETYLRSIGEF